VSNGGGGGGREIGGDSLCVLFSFFPLSTFLFPLPPGGIEVLLSDGNVCRWMVPSSGKKEEPLPGWVVTNNNGKRTRAVPRPTIDPKKGTWYCWWWSWGVGNTDIVGFLFVVQAKRKRKIGRTNGGIWWRNPLFRQR